MSLKLHASDVGVKGNLPLRDESERGYPSNEMVVSYSGPGFRAVSSHYVKDVCLNHIVQGVGCRYNIGS